MKRIGLAVSDDAGFFAAPYATRENKIGRKGQAAVLADLMETISALGIEAIVLGLPRGSSGEVSEMETHTRAFGQTLQHTLEKAKLSIEIYWQDERFSTAQVLRNLRTAGVSQKTAREATGNDSIDARAAAIILQDFLDTQKLRQSWQSEAEI